MLGERRRREPGEIELQAARQDGDRKFLRIGRREQELDVGRGLFQGLQQGVEGMVREHVHLVDEVHLVTGPRRCVGDVVQQFARLVDLGARGGVDFDEVDEATGVDFTAGRAAAARLAGDALLAIEGLGEHARERGLAHTASTGEQIGMVEAVAIEGVDQGLQDMALAEHLGEGARPPFAGEDLVAHRLVLISSAGGGGRASHTPAPADTVTAAPFRA